MSKRIALFFGTFNPIHVGHLIIGNEIAQSDFADEVWYVVTPKNPLKKKSSLLADHHRLYLTQLATEDNPLFRVSDVEFHLPQPNYTYLSLAHLREKHPDYSFSLIMGEDNLRTLHKWKNHEALIESGAILVYPRAVQESEKEITDSPYTQDHPNIKRLNLPVLNLSSSHIRRQIQAGLPPRYALTEKVFAYVDEMNFYRQ